MGSPRGTLGASELCVSSICFGTWQLSPRFWGEQPASQVVEAMHKAVDCGINFFDTSDAYGDGHAETVLGSFLAEARRDNLVVTTKVFNHYNPDGSRYPDLSPDYIVERCEASLGRLQLETIDLYLLHFFDPLTPLVEIADTMDKLRAQGKIRAYGVSNHTVEQLRACRRTGDYTVCQPAYSLVNTGIEADLLPYCANENIGVMVYSPMHKGLLTGKYAGTEKFADFRQYHPDFQGGRFLSAAQGVRSLAPVAEKYGLTLYQLVLAATLMHPTIDVAVVGIKTAEQIGEAAGAAGIVLDRADYFAVRNAVQIDAPTKIRDAGAAVK